MGKYTVSIASKAPFVGYPALIAAAFVPEKVDATFIDDKLVDSSQSDSTTVLKLGEETIFGTEKAVARLASEYPAVFYGDSPKEEVDNWVKFAFDNLAIKDFKVLSSSLEKLESRLNYRSFIVGYGPTTADIAVWGILRSNGIVGGVIKGGSYINLTRWYKFLESDDVFGGSVEKMTKSVNDIRKASKVGHKKEHKANFEINLQDAKDGEVVTRFPPEPSGYLHIGHAKAAILNQYFADIYHGKLIIRFDDTNPSKEKTEYQDAIIEDLALLGVKGDKLTYSSDYFQLMYDMAIGLIKEGKAYCDDTPQETMREQRGEGIASARRDRTVEENLHFFTEEMKNGTEVGLKNCLRAKISVDANNKTLRDPVIYRCNLTPHHRTGTTWKIYPTYDFCVPIVDSIEGVTHALRTIEYRDRNAQYDWMLKALKLRKVHIWDFARVNFVRTLLSKRKLQWFVDKKYVTGWDDPRFPTVRGVRRRGMTVEGLRKFVIAQGPSKNIINLDWSFIWAVNKKVIDPIAPRHTAILKENAVVAKLTGEGTPDKIITEEKPKHKKNPDVGKKPVLYGPEVYIDQEDAQTLKQDEEITLMDWGNAFVESIEKDGDVVKSLVLKLHLDGDFRKTEKKLTWLTKTPENNIPLDLVDFDHLITKDKIEDGENFEDFLTPHTEFHTDAIGDICVKDMKEGDIIQFERKGYYRLDKPYKEGVSPAVFFTIPDGKVVQRYGAKKA